MNNITILPFSYLFIDNYFEQKGAKNATGLVADIDLLLNEEQLEKFRESFNGVISFLVFDSNIDRDLLNYIASGALTRETSDDMLILYCINNKQSKIRTIDEKEMKILLHYEKSQNIELVKFMFDEGKIITLPGLLVFDCVSDSKKSIYVQLEPNDASDIISYFRILNKAINENYKKNKSNFINKLGVSLSIKGFSYEKNINYSFGEYFVKAFKFVRKIKSDLISIFA